MPKKTLRLFEINFNCLQESSKRSSSVEATTISATLQATNALPEIHSSGNLIGKVHLWTVVWKEELNNEKIEHPPILRYCSFSPHSCHSPVSGVGFLAWKLWRTTLILEIWLNHSLPKKIVLVPPPPKKILLTLLSPMFGKVAPPVDHHPTHLAISGAAKCKWEVEKGQLVAVAHTLARD